MDTKQNLTDIVFVHKHIRFNESNMLMPISNYIFKGKFETDVESLYNYYKINTNKICKLFNIDFIIKNTDTLIKKIGKNIKICLSFKDINENDILDISYLIFKFEDFHSFLNYAMSLKNIVILDIAKILGIPKMQIIFGILNSNKLSIKSSSKLNSIDLFILDKFFKNDIINQHINYIKETFNFFVNEFKNNICKADCPFIVLNKKDNLYFQKLKKIGEKYLFCTTDVM